MIGASERHHGVAVDERLQLPLRFMGRTRRGNEIDRVEMKPPLCCLRDSDVAGVNGIERAAE
jgi:hypothetical protein